MGHNFGRDAFATSEYSLASSSSLASLSCDAMTADCRHAVVRRLNGTERRLNVTQLTFGPLPHPQTFGAFSFITTTTITVIRALLPLDYFS